MPYFVERGLMKKHNPFSTLTAFEWALWLTSALLVIISFILAPDDILTLIASLIGVTALIFVAKGHILGQLLSVVFAVFYGIISFFFHYFGEMLTYLCMTAPIALIAVFSWLKHPYKDSAEVEVSRPTGKQLTLMFVLCILVTVVFYFVLGALGTANLLISTFSVTTSFLACYLTYLRSPYYALAYAANDVVLIVLWLLAAFTDISYLPMIVCFTAFLANDLYGFINWRRMQKKQEEDK